MTETTIWPEDGMRARIAELEAENERLRTRVTATEDDRNQRLDEMRAALAKQSLHVEDCHRQVEQAEADLTDLHSSFMADASIHKAEVAELEAEVKRLLEFGKEFIWGEERPTEWRTLFVRAKEAEAALADIDRTVGILRFTIDGLRAALAERDTRRCEMCGHWGKHEMWPDQGWCPQHNEMDADCSCSEWTARTEEGSGDE